MPIGALVLVRDVTEVRRRDRQLITKDATIREIHHRVKNNLQTVAALLRLQARRVGVPGGPDGAGGVGPPGRLDRAGARDAVDVRSTRRSSSTASSTGSPPRPPRSRAAESTVAHAPRGQRSGCCRPRSPPRWSWCSTSCCSTRSSTASPAGTTRPGRPARWWSRAHRFRKQLHVTVADNGRGLPEGFDLDASERLGLQIVRTLATGELRGTIELRTRAGGGTEAVLVVPLAKR